MKKLILSIILLLFVIVFFVRFDDNNLEINKSSEEILSDFIDNFGEISINSTSHDTAFRNLTYGDSVFLSEAEATPLLNSDYTFDKLYTDYVVFVANTNKVSEKKLNFTDILQKNYEINFDFPEKIDKNMWEHPKTHHIVLSMANSLYGDYKSEKVYHDINKIQNENRFFACDLERDLTITLFSDALKIVEKNDNFEIIVPSDGVLYMDYGVFRPKDIDFSYNLSEKRELVLIEDSSNKVTDFNEYISEARNVSKNLMQISLKTNSYSFANAKEITAFFLLLLFALIAYLVFLTHRITDKKILFALKIAFFTQILFIVLGVLKSISYESAAFEIIVWYLYYIPILMLPACLVYITFHSTNARKKTFFDKFYKVYLTVCILLFIVVFTNNTHELIFEVEVFSPSFYTYSYNIGYYFVISFIMISFAVSLASLIFKSFSSPKKIAFVYPVIVNVLLTIYIVCYVTGVQIVREFELSYGNTIFLFLYAETCMRSGLFPNNKGYDKLFANSSLAMKITDKNGKIVENSAVSLDIDENFIPKETEIIGGNFCYFEDFTSINTALRKFAKVNKTLKRNNDFLIENASINADISVLNAKQTVYKNIDKTLIAGTNRAKVELLKLKENPNDKRPLIKINAIICMMKRDCMFRINMLYLKKQQLGIFINALNEIKNFATSINILTNSSVTMSVHPKCVLSMYNFFSETVLRALDLGTKVLVVQLYEKGEHLVFSIISHDEIFAKNEIIEFNKTTYYEAEYKEIDDGFSYILKFKEEDIDV